MKLIILLLLLSTIGYSQSQNLKSYEIIKDGEFVKDTSAIKLIHNSLYVILYVKGINRQYIVLPKPYSKEYINVVGIKSISYETKEGPLSTIVEFLYKSGQLLQITIIRAVSILSYIIHPQKEFL